MIGRKLIGRLAPAVAIAAASLGLAACNGASERAERGVKEDVRGVRDFLHDRGITINTMLPER